MKLLRQGLLIALLLGMTLPALASDPEAQAGLLLAKIRTALENDRTSAALSYCTTLEKLGPSLQKPLPESFYYDFIETLHRSGAKESALNRAYAYLHKYGKNSPHYAQVAAIIKEQQMAAIQAGVKDADAAVLAWEESKEKEQAQTLATLRSCQSEAIALEGREQELSLEFAEISARSESLRAAKAALDKRQTLIDRSQSGTPAEQKQVRLDFNRDSQSYNEAVSAFSRSKELYEAKVEEQSQRLQHFEGGCANLYVVEADMVAVCGKSDDWFCRALE